MTKKRKVAVIGSNSFSGSDFIDLLLEDPINQVIGISRSPEKSVLFLPYKAHVNPDFKFYQLDLNQNINSIIALLDEFRPEYIVNFAAQSEVAPSWENPGQWFQTNAVALANLANALKNKNYFKKYVHISSPEVYGTCEGLIMEDAILNPSTPYAASKAAGDLFLLTLVKNFDFPLVIIRSTNVYGAHQQLFKIIPRSIIYFKSGKTIQLHGGGNAIKSYIHIRDVSRGEFAAMIAGNPGETYHISPDKGHSVKEIVKQICSLLKKDFKKSTESVEERQGQDAAYIINSNKARQQFSWNPSIDLKEGLSSTIAWIEKNWEDIQNEALEYIHKP